MALKLPRLTEEGIEEIEPEEAAEEDWLMVLYGVASGGARYVMSCTPGFYNSELQEPDAKAARNLDRLEHAFARAEAELDDDLGQRPGSAAAARRAHAVGAAEARGLHRGPLRA